MELSLVKKNADHKRWWRIIPLLVSLYVLIFLDRVNTSYATLTMSNDLHFTPLIFGLGAGIFFVGYIILEMPVTRWVETRSAKKTISRVMVSVGIATIMIAFISTEWNFYVLRLAVGLGEAGFFPGMIVYISHWYSKDDRAKINSIFLAAIPISQIIGAPVSTHILTIDWLNLAGWRWLFIFEGLVAIIGGIVASRLLSDRPRDAKWLTKDEKEIFKNELGDYQETVVERIGFWKQFIQAFKELSIIKDRNVILLAFTYLFWLIGFYGLGFFLPTIISGLTSQSVVMVGYLSAIPYGIALVAMVCVGKIISDRQKKKMKVRKKEYNSLFLILGAVGLGVSIMVYPNLLLSLIMFVIATVGIYAGLGIFWTFPTTILSGTAAAYSIAFINSFGNIGGFVGPYIIGYFKTDTGSFAGGEIFMVVSLIIAAILVLCLKKTKPLSVGVEVQ